MKRKPKAIDLFCGCGGLTLGLKQAGFNVIGAIDIDDLAVLTYRTNHSEVEVWHQDITQIDIADLMKKLKLKKGDLDLIAGCPPCQGFSTMRTLKQAGFNVIGAIDIDDLAILTYRANHPRVKIWHKDITQIDVADLMKKLKLKKGDLDLIAGCPPCQGFSTMRTLNGGRKIKDDRNDLIFEFLRFVKELAPKAIMMENVPGLYDDKRFARFCTEIKTLGYIVNADVKDAADYGVPQRRRRTILLAGKGFKIEFARPSKNKKTVADAIRNLPKAGKSGDLLHDLPERRTEAVKRRIAMIPKDGGSRTDLPHHEQLDCHKKCNGFKDVYGRMAWDKPAPTITSGCTNPSKGRFIHPTENRAITLREAALLQSFPQDYYYPADKGKGDIALMIGNALPPEFIKKHSEVIYQKI